MSKHPFTLTGSALIDEDVRLRALNPARSFIVQAPAGSGKTRLLITRYLTLLATVDEPEEIVAITFTRKAAAEMRQRIQAALAAGLTTEAHATPTSPDSLQRAAAAALVRDRLKGWNIAQSPNRFRIQTIDAFNANLARQAPLTTRFGAQPQTSERPQALYAEAARDVLSALDDRNEYSAAIATLLLHLDNDHSKLCGLVAQMLAKRDQWLRNFPGINVAGQSAQLRDGLQRTLVGQRVAKFSAADALFSHPELPTRDQILSHFNYARRNLELREMSVFAGITANDGARWLALAECFLTKTDTIRKTVNVSNGFPATGADAKPQKEAFVAILKTLSAIPNATETLAALRNLPAAQYTDAEWKILEAAWQLLPYAVGCLWQVFARHGQCDFTEVALAADRALGTEDTPTDLALKLDVAIAHILVDEFQDTSQAQYNLLHRLTAQWGMDEGRTLFLVGDPMQSIYRFREAKVGLFLNAQQNGLGDVMLTPCALTLNFRSHPAIIAWINASFSKLIGVGSSGGGGGSINYLPSATPYVDDEDFELAQYGATLHAIAHTPEQTAADVKATEAAKVVACIQAARAQDPTGSVAILVRGRTHLSQILPALRRANIEYVAHDLDRLDQRAVVQDCIALTRALLHDSDRTAWLGCLRAPWCGLSLAELDALFGLNADAKSTNSIYQQLQNIEQQCSANRFSPASQIALLHFKQAMHAARTNFRRQSLRDCVEQCWLSLNGPACCREDRDLTDVSTYFDCLESAEIAGNLINFDTLVESLSGRFSSAPLASNHSTPAVEIMTIHKAKGLEFDTVIVPGLNQKSANDRPELLLWQELDDDHHHHDNNFMPMLLAPIAEGAVEPNKDAPQTIYRYLTQLSNAQQRQEDIRLLYVAATRAAKRLLLLACIKIDVEKPDADLKPAPNSLLAALWPALGERFATLAFKAAHEVTPKIESAASLLNANFEPQRLVREAVAPVTEPIPRPRTNHNWQHAITQNNIARHTGTVIHEWLARIADEGVTSWNTPKIGNLQPIIAQRLASLGILNDPQAVAVVQKQLQSCLNSQRGQWLLQPHAQAKSEWQLAGNIEGNIVHATIDRSFVDEAGVRWIVDYKTAAPTTGEDMQQFLATQQQQYESQMHQYAVLVSRLDNVHIATKIMLALYFPSVDGWQQWAFIEL